MDEYIRLTRSGYRVGEYIRSYTQRIETDSEYIRPYPRLHAIPRIYSHLFASCRTNIFVEKYTLRVRSDKGVRYPMASAGIKCQFPNCPKVCPSLRSMRTHYTLKHVADSASPAKRPRTDRGAEDAGGAYADGGEHEDGGLGYDYDLTGDVDAEHDRSWRVPEDANDIPLEAELNTQLQLYNSSFSIDCQPRPSWVPMNETAAALAQLEYLPSRDLVGERLLSFEEFI